MDLSTILNQPEISIEVFQPGFDVLVTTAESWTEAIDAGAELFQEDVSAIADRIVVLKLDEPGFALVAVLGDELAEAVRAFAEENIICVWTAASFHKQEPTP